ncbi:MAG: peptidase A26 [Lachnospiraceae bacterium]|nr:peptidase A26 [Lachnospiraceae bacterium]
MKENNMKYKKSCVRAAAIGLCTCVAVMSPYQSMAGMLYENLEITVNSGSNAKQATDSNAVSRFGMRSIGTGDLWEHWVGDLSFLSGKTGDGTEEKPFQISTKEHLMGLSELTSKGMIIRDGEGTYPGDYTGCYFRLTRNIDLGGMEWMPIGFYQNEADFLTGEVYPFVGHFDGNGKTISNFVIYQTTWENVGLFGLLENAEITNLIIKPGYVLQAKSNVGILGGSAVNSVIKDVTVMGTVRAEGTAGGVLGEIMEDSIIENCTADHVAVDSGSTKEVYAGGITGKAAESLIADCVVNTGDSVTARIQGDGYVGGIVGFQNGTDIFNVHVMGTIGGNGSQAIGGVTGKYASGKLKVARFEGKIADSGMGSLAREGTFLGTHDTGFHFRYGTESGADLAYLFADTEGKITAGVCGSGIPDDNSYGYDAHIGFWHGKDNFFTLVQGQNTKTETEYYFYEELEKGILLLTDTEEYIRNQVYTPDHFAPNAVGRPTRGYLVSVLQIDTAANVENYYDVAMLSARGESVYSKELDKDTRGAVAAGDIVTVVTAPKNTADEKYQMEGVPTYTDKSGNRVEMAYQIGGSYSFVMPAHDVEISAEYKKVAADIRINPEEFMFRVVQERTGNRKNPSIVTEVKDKSGKLIARYINGALEEGTQVQEVRLEAIVDKNNDVADSCVLWSVDDPNLLLLKKNKDEDVEGYTAMSASVELNLQADFFREIIQKAEKEQRSNGYRYAIPDTVYGNGTQGGLAVLTAKTRPSSSFEGKSAEANCKIPVTFQIKDRTMVAVEDITFDKRELEFTVTRKLTGDRRNPKEEILISPPGNLDVIFQPKYLELKSAEWSISDPYVIRLDINDYSGYEENKEYKSAIVHAVADSKWIKDLMTMDDELYKADTKFERNKSGEKTAQITMTVVDELGNRSTAVCNVIIKFITEDKTLLYGSGSSGSSSKSGTSQERVNAWVRNSNGTWSYYKEGKKCKDQWAYIYNPYAADMEHREDWFRFDADGMMYTGWYQAEDGGWYYLHNKTDGTQGYMYTGWHAIDGRWYYFGTDGRMFYSAETPDGYIVDASGAWIVDGVVQSVK